MNVTAVIGIVSRARAYILRLTKSHIHDLVASDWAARAVLRYWRLRNRCQGVLRVARHRRLRPPLSLAGHALVMTLGFLLVVPAITDRPAPTRAVAAAYSGHVVLTGPLGGRNAVAMREIPKAPTLEDRPAPPVMLSPDPTAAPPQVKVRQPTTVTSGPFVPPPGSGGDGLQAIYAVFGNSPGLSWALRVANCESHYNPLAVNRSSGASGLFQFMPSTWNANFAGWNIWDPYAQARAALVFFNAGRQSAWTCK